MTKLFRNIKQQLLTNNQFSRYFFYAFVEIVLIILGILIALHIDNKNQEKHNLRLEKEYLLSMQTELSVDFENLLRLIENLDDVIERLDVILDSHKNQYQIPLDSITKLYSRMFWVPHFRGHTETFESIESSGHLSLLQNSTLKHDYFQLLKEYEVFDKYYDNSFLSFANDINKNSTKYFALDRMSFIDEKYPYSQDALNNVVMSKLIRISLNGHAKECHQTVNKLIDNIKSELETRFSK